MGPQVKQEGTEEPPEPPDHVEAKEVVRPTLPTSDVPIHLIENGTPAADALIISNEEVHIHLQYARLPKPMWPKSPVTIPSSFFRDLNRRVVASE